MESGFRPLHASGDAAARHPYHRKLSHYRQTDYAVEEFLKQEERRSPRRSLGAAGHTIGKPAPLFSRKEV